MDLDTTGIVSRSSEVERVILMLGRKLFSAFIASLSIALVLAALTVYLNSGPEPFIGLFLIYSIFVVPVIFVYGILTSIFSELISPNYLVSLALHIVFGLLFGIPFNLINSESWMSVVYPLLFALFGGVFFLIDRIIKFYWDKSDLKHEAILDHQK